MWLSIAGEGGAGGSMTGVWSGRVHGRTWGHEHWLQSGRGSCVPPLQGEGWGRQAPVKWGVWLHQGVLVLGSVG